MQVPPNIVLLTWEEVLLGASVGVRRRVKARSVERREVHGDRHYKEPWDLDVEAALAEMAFAKYSGGYWAGQTDPDKGIGDVQGVHVRSTNREEGALILHPTDEGTGTFVLLVGGEARWRVAGALQGSVGKDSKWWRTDVPHPAYFVPQKELWSAVELRRPTDEVWT